MSIARSSTTIIAGLAMLWLTGCGEPPATPPAALRLSLPPVDELVLDSESDYPFGLALGPDGRRMVTAGARDGLEPGLWLRDLSTGDSRRFAGTDGAVMPFWSPDGASVGFFADGKLRALDIAAGDIRDLAEAPTPRGGTWLASGEIIFAPDANGGLSRRTLDGGIVQFTTIEAGEMSHRLPHSVDDEHVIFFVRATASAQRGIWIAPLTQPDARKRLASSDAAGLAAGGSLLYSNGGALVAQRIDRDALALAPKPQLLATSVGHGAQHQLFATVGGDVLIHGLPASTLRELRWVDRLGVAQGLVGEPMTASDVRIAPHEPLVAVARVDPQLTTLDIWTYVDARPLPRRISPSINIDDTPAWSADGSRLAWVSARRIVTVRDALATKPEITIHKFERAVRVTDWSGDGQWIVVSEAQSDGRGDIMLLRARQGGEVRTYLRSPFDETQGTVSPDGRWLAYSSDESGRADVYVDAFPEPRGRARITLGGGEEPRWGRDSHELFFRRGREVHTVKLQATGNSIEALASERLFDSGAEIRSFDAASDGERFLLNVPAAGSAPPPLKVLVHVSSLLPSAP
jgi:hypothetical protein